MNKLGFPALAFGLVLAMGFLQARALSQPVRPSKAPARPFALTLHGNTPTMAWSPDGRRLAVNAAYTYYGWDREFSEHEPELGVYVVDPIRHHTVHVGPQSGYHPLWLDNDTVAWGHSPYENGQAGVFVSPAGDRLPQRIGAFDGVYHTQLSASGGILFWNGYPENKGWTVMNREGTTRPAGVGGTDSWSTPAAAVDQCVQRVGTTRVSKGFVNGALRWSVQSGTEQRTLEGTPYWFAEQDNWLPEAHRGPVWPCLAPDGSKVAWFEKTAVRGTYRLRVQVLR